MIYLRLSTGFDILVFFTNSNLMEIQIGYLSLFRQFSVIDGFQWFIYDLSGLVVFNIAIYPDDTNVYSNGDQAFDLWQQLRLASDLEADLTGHSGLDMNRLVDFNAWKNSTFSFDRLNNWCYLKMNGAVLYEKSTFNVMGFSFSSKLVWNPYIASIAKTSSNKFGP